MPTPQEVLLRQIELCRRLEASEDCSEKTRIGAAELRTRFEARLSEEISDGGINRPPQERK